MTRKNLAATQLAVLTLLHFTVDGMSGTIAGFLPALMDKYSLSIGVASWLITTCSVCSNALQIPAGYLRSGASRPLLIPIGFLLVCLLLGIGLIPAGPAAFCRLLALVTAVGAGVALVHPEGLRAVCAIDRVSISPTTATSVFMLAGFLGYACGPLAGGALVELGGFHGLWLLLILIVPLFFFFFRARIRLAGNTAPRSRGAIAAGVELRLPDIFIISTFINTGCAIMQGLLPSYLDESGFSLAFGGLSAMLFGLGSGLGALFTGSVLLRRFSVAGCLITEWCLGIPLLVIYLLTAETAGASVLLGFAAGLLTGAGYPQLVVLTRSVPSRFSLGVRMGIIVGGTWALAGMLFQLTGFLADAAGLRLALLAAPLAFLMALAYLAALYLHRR